MDEIREMQEQIINYESISVGYALTLQKLEDEMVKAVFIEHLKTRDPMLSNDKMRWIAAKDRLDEMEEYTEAVAEKYAADESIKYGNAYVEELKRAFIVKYMQIKPIV